MSRARKILIALAGVALITAATVETMRAGWWNTNRAEVTAKWAKSPSRFVTVDGVPIHLREEGQGPVVVMLHGSIANLHEWDEVAARLAPHYRVVRFDWSPYGLSGPDPSGVYTTARAAQLMDGLLKQLKIDQFALVSTSNGANVALEYNKQFPGHATAMAFSMLPLERPSQTRKVDWRIQWMKSFHDGWVPGWHPHIWFRLILKDTTPPSFNPTDEMVDQLYDMNNLPGAAARQKAYLASNTHLFKTTDVAAIAETVHVPVLLQWCSYDTVISQGAAASVKRFTNTHVELIEYKDLGHFPMWEDPERFTRDLASFLANTTYSNRE